MQNTYIRINEINNDRGCVFICMRRVSMQKPHFPSKKLSSFPTGCVLQSIWIV